VTLTNVTISGNSAGTGGGGFAVDVQGTATIRNVTIARNTAALGGGIILSAQSGTVSLIATIVANNTSHSCVLLSPRLTSLGSNLSSDASCPLAAAGDRVGTNPRLGPLRRQPLARTATHALLAGSPAIDAAARGCPPPARDQRGVRRPQDGDGDRRAACDVGAYEVAARR
jgi:hypothetical protein